MTTINIPYSKRNETENLLHQFASYNYVLTLSGLSRDDLKANSFLKTSVSRAIIARSSGIGNDTIQTRGGNVFASDTMDKREYSARQDAKFELNRNRDIYFENLSIKSIHSLNSERRTGQLSNIEMTLIEPSGITLFKKLVAAADVCGYRDYIDAPFLLTIEFVGVDEMGNSTKLEGYSGTRKIPIKLINCEVDVTGAGSTYHVKAVPYSEFGFMNRFLYTRTSFTIEKKLGTLSSFLQSLEKNLNQMTTDEADQGIFTVGMQPVFKLSVDPSLANLEITPPDSLYNTANVSMTRSDEPPGSGNLPAAAATDKKAGQIRSGVSITKMIEDVILSSSKFDQKVKDSYKEAAQEKVSSGDSKTSYVDWFRMKTSIDVDNTRYDPITKQHPKIIQVHVAPMAISIFHFSAPGLKLASAKSYKARRTYNYIFTGDNTDILDVNLKYKVAYFQSRVKDMTSTRLNDSALRTTTRENSPYGTGERASGGTDPSPLRSDAGVARSAPSGGSAGYTSPVVDSFMDALTNPTADMVKLDMTIMGDPAWIGQTQFLHMGVDGPISVDKAPGIVGSGSTDTWNSTYKAFNAELADPVVVFNFKMPSDFNEHNGTYNFTSNNASATEEAMFSGVYHVFQTMSKFEGGTFTQVLGMRRFNNQDVDPGNITTTTIEYDNINGFFQPTNQSIA